MKKTGFIKTLARGIVYRRKLYYLVFIILFIASALCIPKTKINYDITDYLPNSTETKQSVDIMKNQFVTYATAQIMVSNISVDTARELYEKLSNGDILGAKSISFPEGINGYRNSSAKYSVTFDSEEGSDKVTKGVQQIRKILDGYDVSIACGSSFSAFANQLKSDITKILIISVFVIAAMVIFTSKSFMELPIFFIVFGVAAVLNMGTNWWFGRISFISNSVAIILQLALAIDYAIILSHRFTQEKERHTSTEEAVVAALSKAIPEIFSSSLTTVSGMIAMMFMQLRIGLDLGLVLAKSIVCSLFTVFVLMPGLLVMFGKLLEKTKHKNFVPKITFWGKFVMKVRHIVPLVFVFLLVGGFVLQLNSDYVFSQEVIDTKTKMSSTIEKERLEGTFGKINQLAILVPKGDFEKERQVLDLVGKKDMINEARGLANHKINEKFNYYLTDSLKIKEFAKAVNIDADQVRLIYGAYALFNQELEIINIDEYRVPFLDMVDFASEQIESGAVTLTDEQQKKFDSMLSELNDARVQVVGKTYSRLVFNIDGPLESKETFKLLDEIKKDVSEIYPDAKLAGLSTSSYDMYKSFTMDNMLIAVLTIAFILIILLFTFKSVGIPLLLILIIQGSVWLNFAIPVLMHQNVFFFTYIIVGAIQMGATIDYAIVITSRFQELKKTMPLKDAAIETLNQCFPTVLTSGSILTIMGFLIGNIVNEPIVSSIGMALGRGTIISIFAVLIVLPQCLVLFSKLIDKTSFNINLKEKLGLDFKLPSFKKINLIVEGNENHNAINYVRKNELEKVGKASSSKNRVLKIDDKIENPTKRKKIIKNLKYSKKESDNK